jgi:hypothetical protein
MQRALLRMGTDWLGQLSDWAAALTKLLLAIPAFLGLVATYFVDVRAQLSRLHGVFARKL